MLLYLTRQRGSQKAVVKGCWREGSPLRGPCQSRPFLDLQGLDLTIVISSLLNEKHNNIKLNSCKQSLRPRFDDTDSSMTCLRIACRCFVERVSNMGLSLTSLTVPESEAPSHSAPTSRSPPPETPACPLNPEKPAALFLGQDQTECGA